MTKRANGTPPDAAQMSLGGIVTSLPAVKVAKKANTLSRVHRRLIDRADCRSPTSAARLLHRAEERGRAKV